QAEVLEPQRTVEEVRGYAVPAGGLPLRLPHGQIERVQALLDPAGHHLQQPLTLQRELLTGLPGDRERVPELGERNRGVEQRQVRQVHQLPVSNGEAQQRRGARPVVQRRTAPPLPGGESAEPSVRLV